MLRISASGRGDDGDLESRVDPDRYESILSDQPTQIPEAPE